MPGSVIAYTGNDVAISGVVLNTIEDGCVWTVADIDGWWGLPEATAPASERSVYEDGSTAVAGRYLSRKLKLTGSIVPTENNPLGDSFPVAARNAFNRALNLIRTQGVLQVNDNPAKMAYVQVVDRPLMKFSKANDVLTFEVSLRASDPRKYSIHEELLTTEAYLGNIGRTYNKVYDYTYGAAGSSGLVNAYNEGTYNTFGKIVIHGPVQNPVVEHISSNSRLAFDITLAIGQSLEIDLAVHTVTLDGANRRSSLLPSSKWFSLAPGDNFIKFSGTQNPLPQAATNDRVNLVINPNATSGSAQGWVQRVPGDTLTVGTISGTPGNNVFIAGSANNYTNPQWGFETASSARPAVTPFDLYAFSIAVRQKTGAVDPNTAATPRLLSANIAWYDLNGTLLKSHESTAYAVPSDRWIRISTVAQAPSGAVKASLFVRPTQYQYGLANALTNQGMYFDDALFEKVFSQTEYRKNIATNGNLTQDTSNWQYSDPSNPTIGTFDRTWFALDGYPVNFRDQEKDVSDWYVRGNASTSTSPVNRYGYKYTISSGFTAGEEYTFAGNVRSTIDQNWAVKVKALTSGGVAITGTDGSQYITQGTGTYVNADTWARISSVAVVPSGTASLQVFLEPANGTVFAVNAVTNPGFERTAKDETALNAVTFSDSFGQNPFGPEVIKNYAAYPDSKGVGVFPNYWSVGSFGTGGLGSIISSPTGGYLNGYAAKKTWTTAPTTPATAADLGILYTVTPAIGWADNSFRPPTSVRAWVTASRTTNQQLAIEFINASSATVSTWVGPAVSIGTAGGWIIAENLNTGLLNWTTLRVHIGPYAAGFTPAIGDYITASGLMVEYSGTSHIYFSGSAANTWDKSYQYDGLPNGPTSVHNTSQVKYRENLATNPRPFSSATNWTYTLGTGGAATLSTVTNEIGPTDLYGFRRAAITTADTGANAGHLYRQDGTFTGVVGDQHMTSMWVRSSVAISVQGQLNYRAAAANVGTAYTSAVVNLPANVWTRVSVAGTATTAYDGMQLFVFESATGPIAGTNIDATGVLIETTQRVDTLTNLVNDPSFEGTTGSTVVNTNIFPDPRAVGLTAFESNTPTVVLSTVPGFGDSPSAIRGTRGNTSAARLGLVVGAGFAANTTYTVVATLRASALITGVTVAYRPNTTSNTAQTVVSTANIPAGVSQVTFSGLRSSSVSGANSGIAFTWSSGAVNDTLDITDITVVQGTYAGPHFDAVTPPISTVNLMTNPNFDATSGTTIVRTNLAKDPALTRTDYITATGPYTQTAGTPAQIPFTGSTFRRLTVNATTATAIFDTQASGTSQVVVAAGGMTYSMWLRSSRTVTVTPTIIHTASTGDTGRSSPSQVLNAGVWTRVYVTTTITTPGAIGLRVATSVSGSMQVGDTLDIGGALVEQMIYPTGSYFDGTTPAAGGLTSAWTGTANASTTTLTGAGVAGISGYFASAGARYQAVGMAEDGGNALGMFKFDATTNGMIVPASGVITVKAGQTITATIRTLIPVGSSASLSIRTSTGSSVGATGTISGTGAWVTLTSSYTSVTDGDVIGFHYYGSSPAGTTIFVDKVTVVVGVGAYTGAFFDGDTAANGLLPKWTGTPGASTSYLYDKTYYDPAWTTAWVGTANASSSTLNSSTASAINSANNITVLSSGIWSAAGSRSARLVPNNASNDSYVVIASEAATRVLAAVLQNKQSGLTNSSSIFVQATIRRDVNSVAPRNLRNSNVYVFYTRSSSGATQFVTQLNTLSGLGINAGVTRLSQQITIPDDADSLEFRVYNGTSIGNGDLWVDAFSVNMVDEYINKDYISYFDGTTSAASGYSVAWNGAANASTSVRFLAAAPTLGTYFDGGTSNTKELFRNYVTYPHPNAAATGWNVNAGTGATASIAFNAGTGAAANGFVRGTWTVASTVAGTSNIYTGVGQVNKALVANATYSAGMWIRPSVDMSFAARIIFHDTAGTLVLTGALGATTFCPANQWTLVKVENQASTSTTYAAVLYAVATSTVAAGTTIDADQAILVSSSTLPAYFDGATSNTANTSGAWLDGAYASQSVLRGEGDASFWWNTGNAFAESSVMTYPVTKFPKDSLRSKGLIAVGSTEYQNNAHQGSLRLTPASDINDSYVDLFWDQPVQPPGDGKSYTLYATVVVEKAQTGTLHPNARKFAWMTQPSLTNPSVATTLALSDAIPNVPGRYPIKWSATIPSGTPFNLRFYNGSTKGNGDIWLERFSIVAGSTYDAVDPYYATNQGLALYELTSTDETTSFQRTGVSEVYRNSVENPKFSYLGSREPNVTRTNLLTDPRGTSTAMSNPTGWSSPTLYIGGSLVASTQSFDGPEGRPEFIRLSNTPGIDPQLVYSEYITPQIRILNQPFKVGDVYTFSVWARFANGGPVALRASLLNPLGSQTTQVSSDVQVLAPNTWTRLFITFIVENPFSDAALIPNAFRGELLIDPSTNSATQTYDYGSALLEKTDKVLPYFDGAVISTATHQRGWSGTANASSSFEVQTGLQATRRNLHPSPTTSGQVGDAASTQQWVLINAGGGVAPSATRAGIADTVFTYTSAGTSTNTPIISTTTNAYSGIAVVPFTEYAFSADTLSTVALTNGSRVDIAWYDKNLTPISSALGTATAISVTGTYQRRSILAVSPSGARFAKPIVVFPSAGASLVVGSSIGGTNALFERANFVDTFFSGTTPASGSLGTAVWDGVRNASSSSLLDSRKMIVRTNYAREAIPSSTASTRWTFTFGGGAYGKLIEPSALGPNNVTGWYRVVCNTSTGGVPSVWGYSEKINGVAGDTFIGSIWLKVNTSGISGVVNASITYKLAGVTVNTTTTALSLNTKTWQQLFTPSLAATGAYDEVALAYSTTLGGTSGDEMRATQALLEKTTQQLPWFDANNPANVIDRINEFSNPSFEWRNEFTSADTGNQAANSGPFNTLAGVGSWSTLPALGATVATQLMQAAPDGPAFGAPNYVRNVYSTIASATGEKGIQYLNAQSSATITTGTYLIDMYVRSSVALPARLSASSEGASSVVIATSSAVTDVNLVPGQWTRLRTTLVASAAFQQIRVKALVGAASASLPVGTTLDVSSVLIAKQATGNYREYNDKNLTNSDWRVYTPGSVGQITNYSTWYTSAVTKNLVLDPTLQYGAADWTITPGWGTGGTGTSAVELGKGVNGGYSEVRRWTATPSNSTSVSGIGVGYLFRAAVATQKYSFTALYSASKASSADAWVTWYTDATLTTPVSSQLLSSVAYSTSGTGQFIQGDGAIAPATAGFGLFSVGAWNAGFNPQAGDWQSLSNMRIDDGTRLLGGYFDAFTISGTDNRYQVNGQPGSAITYEMAALPYAVTSGTAAAVLDKSWASTGARSLRVVPLTSTSNDTYAQLLAADSQSPIVQSLPFAQTYTISGTMRVGADGHTGTHARSRTISVLYYDQSGVAQPIVSSVSVPASTNTQTRVSLTLTIPAFSQSVDIRLYNGGYYGEGPIWWDDVLVEQSSTVNDYFDGNSTAVPVGKKASWAATANKSISLMQNIVSDYVGASSTRGSDLIGTKPYTAEPLDGTIATQAIRGASASPSTYLRVANFASTSNDVYATVGGGAGALRLDMQAGRTYTVIGTVMLETVQTGSLHANARTITIYYKTASAPASYQSFVSAAAPNAVGSYTVRNTFTLPVDTTEAYVALYSGSASGQDRLYWTNVALVPYAYAGPYFDGQTAAWNAGEQPAWVGAINASASVVTGLYPSHVYTNDLRVLQSPSWSASGTYSLKTLPIGSEDSYVVVRDELGSTNWGSPYLPTTATTPRVISAVLHIEIAQAGTLSPYARSIVAVNSTTGAVSALATAPNVPGTYQLTATLPGNYALRELRLYNGSTAVSGSPVWWDNFGVFYVPTGLTVPGTPAYSGPYFDGDTPGAGGVSYAWINDEVSSVSMAASPGTGFIWPQDAVYYADKISANSTDVSGTEYVDYFDGRTPAATNEVYYYADGDETSVTYVRRTIKPAVDTYFDGNTGGARWDGTTNGSTSTLPGLPYIPKSVMDLRYRSAWIE